MEHGRTSAGMISGLLDDAVYHRGWRGLGLLL